MATSLAGDTKEVRDLGYISWTDPLAPLEDPTSKLFKKTVRQEEVDFQKQLKGVHVTPWKELYSSLETAYPLSPEYAHSRIPWVYDTVLAIQKRPTSPTYAAWILYGARVIWHETSLTSVSYSVDGLLGIVKDIGKGSEVLQLEVYELEASRKMKEYWKRSPVGPTVGFYKDQLLYLGVDVGGLRYNSIFSVTAKTGKGILQIYNEKDEKVQLELLTPHRQPTVFIRGSNSLKQWIGIVEDGKLHIQSNGIGTLIPIAYNIRVENNCVRVGSKEIQFPLHEFGLNGTLGSDGSLYITTISYGKTSLWKLEKDTLKRMGPKPTHPREIHFLEGLDVHVLMRCPYQADRIVRVEDGKTVVTFPTPLPLRLVKSGIRKGVPFTVVRSSSSRPLRGLLVEAYGAYGLYSRRSYPIRWLPWLAAGWAVAIIAPRGGRDHGDAWWDGARGALNKHHTFEDAAIGIRSAQLCTGVKASNTVLYGRSAGGWCAAMTGQNHPELLGAIYAEVPYVDILRTTTNDRLPLTTMEYEEFGDPIHHPQHFTALAKITPMLTIPSALEGIDMPFVLARTGLYDKQVATYEVLKWAIRLRTAGWTVAVGIDTKGGHFASTDVAVQQYAEDAALLDSLIGYTPPRHHSTVRHPRSTSAR
jgi:hypothetical protein